MRGTKPGETWCRCHGFDVALTHGGMFVSASHYGRPEGKPEADQLHGHGIAFCETRKLPSEVRTFLHK